MFPALETERLILREITDHDAEGLFAYFSDPEVLRYYGQEPFASVEEARQLVSFFADQYSQKRVIRWGIERKGSKGIIGTIGFHAWFPRHRRAEIGYEISREHWRKGYVSEALAEIISYGFNQLELTRIGAIVFTENKASNDLLLKMGFQREGILRDYMYQDGKAYDTYVYSILNSA